MAAQDDDLQPLVSVRRSLRAAHFALLVRCNYPLTALFRSAVDAGIERRVMAARNSSARSINLVFTTHLRRLPQHAFWRWRDGGSSRGGDATLTILVQVQVAPPYFVDLRWLEKTHLGRMTICDGYQKLSMPASHAIVLRSCSNELLAQYERKRAKSGNHSRQYWKCEKRETRRLKPPIAMRFRNVTSIVSQVDEIMIEVSRIRDKLGKLLGWARNVVGLNVERQAADAEYDRKVAQQIAQYAETEAMHHLPEIFHLWSNEFVLPGLQSVFNVSSVTDFYVSAFLDSSRGKGNILSIGCGDGSVEIDIANALLKRGITNFEIVGADLSPILLTHMRAKIEAEGLSAYVSAVEADLNKVEINNQFDLIIANHSLHHIVELEQILDFSLSHLKDDGLFATSDMIGRNGHQRWPETAAPLEKIWPSLPEKQRFNVQLKRLDAKFTDYDCSTEGFEGIRAQDILPLMLERFYPKQFFGFGGFIEVLVERSFGHGYDPADPNDAAFIRRQGAINDELLDAGAIKPTMMFATFSKHSVEEKHYRNRSARNSV